MPLFASRLSFLAVSALCIAVATPAGTCAPSAILRIATSDSAQPADAEPEQVTISRELEIPILRCGITPELLTATGVSTSAVASVLDAAAANFAGASALETADATFSAARESRNTLKRLVESGLGTEEDAMALAAAETALASATAARDLVLSSALAAGRAELTSAQQSTLTSLIAGSRRRVPTQFKVLDLTEANWVKLRNALDDEKSAPKIGLDPDAALQSFLADQRAVTAVATAKANLDANLTAIQAAWDATFVD